MAFTVEVFEGVCVFTPTTGFVPPNASLDLHVDAIAGDGRAIIHSRTVTTKEREEAGDDGFDELFGMRELARARQAGEYGRVEVQVASVAPIDIAEPSNAPAAPAASPPHPVAREASTMPIKPGELDAFHVCHEMLELVLTSRRHLASMQ